jgi:hypothetical protein
MHTSYQARWATKERAGDLRKSGRGVLLDTLNGFLVIEPAGADLGDGEVLTREEADFELQPVWFLGPRAKLLHARRLLGLGAGEPVGAR